MMGNFRLFTTYRPCITLLTVHIADGSSSNVAGIGTIRYLDSFILSSVLYVPNLRCNLLSVSKLTGDLQCTANFSSSSVVFQDSASRRRIGSDEMNTGFTFSSSWFLPHMFPTIYVFLLLQGLVFLIRQ